MEKNNKIELYMNEKLKEEQIKVPMLDYEINDKGNYQYTTKIYDCLLYTSKSSNTRNNS